jgi:segregation and condensation protein B
MSARLTAIFLRSRQFRRSPPEQLGSISLQSGVGVVASKELRAVVRKAAPWRQRLARRSVQAAEASDAWGRDDRTARLEAVLFLTREPVSSRKLAQLAHLADGTEARTLVRRLNRVYDESGSAFRAEELAGGFQLMSRPKFGVWLRRLYDSPGEVRLSAPALETLAVVAYRQPVLRAEIEAIRGVDCGEILRQLMDRDLVRTAGRADELGRPYRYASTKRFLQVFGLRHLEDLPRADLLRNPLPDPNDQQAANQPIEPNPQEPNLLPQDG